MFGNCLEQLSNIYDSVDSIMITNREGIIEYTAVIDAGKCSIGNEGYTGRHLLEVYPDLTEAESTMFRVMKTGQPIPAAHILLNWETRSSARWKGSSF